MCAVLYSDSLYSSNGSIEQFYFRLHVTRGKKKETECRLISKTAAALQIFSDSETDPISLVHSAI